MTIIADQVFAPGERVVRGTSVAVKVVAAEGREGAIMIPGTMHSVQGRIEMRVDPETGIAAINLEPNTGTPANNYYQWIRQVPGSPPTVESIEVPANPASSTLSAGVTLPASTIPVADASSFAAATPELPGLVSIGGQIVLYTGKTGTTLTGAFGGEGTFALGTTVTQGYWVGHVLVDPPEDLPHPHSRQPTDAHDASAISVSGLAVANVQAALAPDGPAETPSLRTLGHGPTQAFPGDANPADRIPSGTYAPHSLPPPTGGIVRSVASKSSDTVDLRDFGVIPAADRNDGAAAENNSGAIAAALAWALKKGVALSGTGMYAVNAEVTMAAEGATLGALGLGQTAFSAGVREPLVLVGHHLSGSVVRIRARSVRLIDVIVDASDARYGAAVGNNCGVRVEPADTPGATLGRPEMRNVTVQRQPGDGVAVNGCGELGVCDNVTVLGNKRHGFVVDDGTMYGRVNRDVGVFVLWLSRCRAFENGGYGAVLGAVGQSAATAYLLMQLFEALGNCWDSTHRIAGEHAQVWNNAKGSVWVLPDLEDQQYANALDLLGNSRTALAAPSRGMYVQGDACDLQSGHFSSLTAPAVRFFQGRGHRLWMPRSFTGAFATVGDRFCEIGSGAIGARVDIDTLLLGGAWTRAVQNQSVTSRISIDGVEHAPTAISTSDVKIVTDNVPIVAAVTGGTAAEPTATIMQFDAQSDTAPVDTVFRVNRSGYPSDRPLEVRAKAGETMTYSSGTATSGTAKGLVLGAGTRVLSSPADRLVLYYNAQLDLWKELRYEDNA